AAASGLPPRLAPPPIALGPMLDSTAIYADDALLYAGTAPPERASAGQLTEVRITSAFNVAKTTGYFDPSVFPNVQTGNDRFSRTAVIQALAGLDAATVVTQLNAGNRLTLYRDTSGRVVYRF